MNSSILRTPFITVTEVTYCNRDAKTELCVVGLFRVSEEKHTFSLPKTTLKPLLADPP